MPARPASDYKSARMNDDTPTERIDPDDAPTSRALAVGQRVLGRYTLEAVAGRGGMGVVWRARDEELGETLALKFLPEVVARDPVAVDELKEETRRARRLRHPNIVQVYDFVRDDAMAAVSMEFVDGTTMAHRRLEQPGKVFTVEKLAPFVPQLCAALDYAHLAAKIVHRDLKPANLLVTRDGQLKVTDFGIARSLTETHTRITGSKTGTSGTLPYMSPQQLAGDKPSSADDIYALGATLYELLAGKPPFHRGDAYSLMKQISERAPLSLAAQRTELELSGEPIPPVWEETILACLAKDPGQRPATAGAVAARLGLSMPGLAAAVGPVTESSGHRVEIAPDVATAKSKTPLFAGVAAAALLLAGAGFYFFVYRPAQERIAAARAQQAEVAQAEEQKKRADEAAERQRQAAEAVRLRTEKEVADALAKTKADREERAYAVITARIDATPDNAPRAQVDATALAVQSYLVIAPERYRGEVAAAWAKRQAALAVSRVSTARGSLIVRTTPDGAEVRVGALALDKSPLTLKGQMPGQYPVRVRLAGYEEWNGEIDVKENEFAELNVPLVRSRGRLVLETEPAGLPYRLQGTDGNFNGVADGRPRELPAGRYLLTVLRQGYPEFAKNIEVRRDAPTTETVAVGPTVAGLWKFSPPGRAAAAPAIEVTLKLERRDGRLTGSLTVPGRAGNPATESQLSNVTFRGDQLAFSLVRAVNGRRFETKYAGRIQGDTITGSIETEMPNGQTRTLEWTARRAR